MKVRETKEVEREISFEELCMYEMATQEHTYSHLAKEISKRDGFIRVVRIDTPIDIIMGETIQSNMKIYAKFRISEEREMTRSEKKARLILEFDKLCKPEDCYNCVFSYDNSTKCKLQGSGIWANKILKDKSIISDDEPKHNQIIEV